MFCHTKKTSIVLVLQVVFCSFFLSLFFFLFWWARSPSLLDEQNSFDAILELIRNDAIEDVWFGGGLSLAVNEAAQCKEVFHLILL